jgi:hypothetical protein
MATANLDVFVYDFDCRYNFSRRKNGIEKSTKFMMPMLLLLLLLWEFVPPHCPDVWMAFGFCFNPILAKLLRE